jgi:alpha-glucosidase
MYQVQEAVVPRPENKHAPSSGAALQFEIKEQPFSFKVTRKENNEVLFDSSGFSLVYESQYIRLRTKLPDKPNLYGLGEHSDPLRFATQSYTRVLWNAESPAIPTNANLYGSHPIYFDHRGDKGTHGVFLLNANGMDVKIDRDDHGQFLEYNILGGVIDLYFLAGPSPVEVSKQYADTIGHPAMYAYWTLGFHQCKYGYWDVNMVAEVVANYSQAEIPLEVMWTDIDYMDRRRDFTLDPDRFPLSKMRELVATLQKRNQRYVLILDPAILIDKDYPTYQRGKELDVFLHNDQGGDFLGAQWAGVMAWPDWFHPQTTKWWSHEVGLAFSADSGVDVDGIWVDMNEASNFCQNITCDPYEETRRGDNPPKPGNAPRPNTGRPIPGFPDSFQPTRQNTNVRRELFQPNVQNTKARRADSQCTRQADFHQGKGTISRNVFEPKYKIKNHYPGLSDKTIYTNVSNCDGTQHYDTHSLYGHMMAMTTYDAMLARRPAVRPFVLTRSTFAGSGRKAAHWFGDNNSSWEHYRTSIRQMLAFVAMHQMPMVGTDVCGFLNNADDRMCARWTMLGAFQPFYRNHAVAGSTPQEFYVWNLTTLAAHKAIATRYRLLDYAYTALYYQTKDGTPWINPLFFLYPNDPNTYGLQDQWFYGDALLISPVIDDYSDTVTFYLPPGRFYDYWTHLPLDSEGKNMTLHDQKWHDIPVHIRGGTIIPERVNSAMTTTELRKEAFVAIIAPATDGTASGRLYLDDGESLEQKAISEIKFNWDGKKFSVSGTFDYKDEDGKGFELDRVILLGQDKESKKWKFDPEKHEIEVKGPGVLDDNWEITIL